MTALLLLARRYALPIGILLALGAGYWWHSAAVRSADHAGYARARAEMAAQVTRANDFARATEQASQKRTNEVAERYEQTLQSLDDKYRAAADRLRRVRLCPSAGAVHVPSTTAAAASTPAPTGTDEFPGQAPPDPRVQRLILLARDADGCAARLASLQDWARSIH